MPLTRAGVTAASRIMLPTDLVLALVVGLVYVTDPGHRVSRAPAYHFQQQIEPLWLWGVVMLALAGLMLFAFLRRSRTAFEGALAAFGLVWALWALTILPSVWETPNTSLLAPALPAYVSVASFASMRSLLVREAS